MAPGLLITTLMALVDSLLAAIVRSDADALIMHVGEKPYVVTQSGEHLPLSTRILTLEAVSGMLAELLPPEQVEALSDLEAVEHPLASDAFDQRFRVVAARGGEDIWIEVRRQPPAASVEQPQEEVEPAPPPPEPPLAAPVEADPASRRREPLAEGPAAASDPPAPAAATTSVASGSPPEVERRDPVPRPAQPFERSAEAASAGSGVTSPSIAGPPEAPSPADDPPASYDLTGSLGPDRESFDDARPPATAAEPASAASPAPPEPEMPEVQGAVAKPDPDSAASPVRPHGLASAARFGSEPSPATPAPAPVVTPTPRPLAPRARSVASGLPGWLSRLYDAALQTGASTPRELDRLLQRASARGASAMYLVAQSKPVLRVEGEIAVLTDERVLSDTEVARLIQDVASESRRLALKRGALTEWLSDVPGVGRVRCMTFRDQRGMGAVFNLIPTRGATSDQLGLPQGLRDLCRRSDGLLIVTGPRAAGKSTLMSALVDEINRSRGAHVVTIESPIRRIHEVRRALISQREAFGSDEMLLAARAALHEDPDVLVIEDLISPDLARIAVEAADAGRFVIGGIKAASTVSALEWLVEQWGREAIERAAARETVAATLCGVVAQVLLRRPEGGRVPARELVLNQPHVASLIVDGRLGEIPSAIASGRRAGMLPLNDTLAALVDAKTVNPHEALRRAFDREGLRRLLEHPHVGVKLG